MKSTREKLIEHLAEEVRDAASERLADLLNNLADSDYEDDDDIMLISHEVLHRAAKKITE